MTTPSVPRRAFQFISNVTSTSCGSRYRATPRSLGRLAQTIALSLVLLACFGAVANGQESAYQRAKIFLDDRNNANTILQFVHFGAAYRGHQFLRVTGVQDGDGNLVPGEVAYVYRFLWEDDGVTEMAFFLNGAGAIVGSSIVSDNGVLSRPFVLANLSIQVLGHLIVDSNDKMSQSDRNLALKLIDNADSRGLLAFWLRYH